jgi:hypothetical protein
MRDTIELLEAIGHDASLRHASTDELMQVLDKAEASEGLRQSVASGDAAALVHELGLRAMHTEQSTHTAGHEEEDEDGDRDDDDNEQESDRVKSPGDTDRPAKD